MRVDKSDLDDAVVEDGEAAVIITDSQKLTKKNKAASMGIIATPNGTHLPNGYGDSKEDHAVPNGGVAPATKERVPVEDWDGEGSGKEDGVDFLTTSLKGCSIHESTKLGIEDSLAELTVRDGAANDEDEPDSPCTSLQSQSSTITVEPPSLPHEQEEEGGEVSELLAHRGPTAGKPASFQPNNYDYNRISGKSYTTLNLDRFQPQPLAGSPQHQTQQQQQNHQAGYALAGLSQTALAQPGCYQNISGPCGGAGKRGMEDEEDNPYKYTRPGEDPGYPGCQPYMNDLSPDRKNLAQYVSPALGSGGQVTTKTSEIMPMLPFEDAQNNSLYNIGVTSEDLEESLQLIKELEGGGDPCWQYPQPSFHVGTIQTQFDFTQQQIGQKDPGAGMRSDLDLGYSSENSPHSDTAGSPGSSPKSTFSPMRPPSNMSHDSGIASPFSSGVPSPPEDYSQTRHWVPPQTAEELSSSQFGMGDNSRSPVYMSNPPAPQNAAVLSPPSALTIDDLTLTSAASPGAAAEALDLLAGRRDELKDALDVVAKDLRDSSHDKKAAAVHGHQHHHHPHRTQAPAQDLSGSPAPGSLSYSPAPVPVSVPAPPLPVINSNIPTSVIPQGQSERPVKLPLPPLVKPAAASSGLLQQHLLQQQHQQPQPVMKVPVMVVPSTLSGQPATSAATAVTSSQPLILMPSGQTPPVIVLVSNPQPQTSQQPAKKKQPVAIRPRPGPPISTSPSSTSPSSNPATSSLPAPPAGDRPCPGAEPGLSGGPVKQSASPGPIPSTVQSPGKKNTHNRNNQPARMLTIARRLVASMTTQDLSFQDIEGDTYLHVSVCKADIYMVQALLERMLRENLHSLINTQNNMRQTPVYLAVSSNAPRMVELLIQYNADVNVLAEHTSADGRTTELKAAIHCAASSGEAYVHTLQALLTANNLKIDLDNSDGHNALHCAILEHGKASGDRGVINNLPLIQTLMRHGLDPNAQGHKSGKTALMYALESRDIVLIEQMVALIDPARLRACLKAQAFDGTSCLRILENLQRTLDIANRQRLMSCFKLRRDNGVS